MSATARERIVVGIDGSPASIAALRLAAVEAARRAGRLDAVIAWRPTPAIPPPAGHPAAGGSLQQRREDAETILEEALQEIEPAGVEIERRVMRGSPHRVLLEAAEGASMLVIGAHTGKLAGKLPWSTGEQLVHGARCPVVVVPPGAGPGLSGEQAGRSGHEGAVTPGRASPGSRRAGIAGGGMLPG